MTNPNDPASPINARSLADIPDTGCAGLSKREHFAALAMQGLLALPERPLESDSEPQELAPYYAQAAVIYADALIAALNANPE